MKRTYIRWLTACLLGLPLLSVGALAQSSRLQPEHPDVVTEARSSRPLQRRTWTDSARAARSGGVSTTPDNQILVELTQNDFTVANPFDLNGYSRSVGLVAWEPVRP